jgi:hypothetical protein
MPAEDIVYVAICPAAVREEKTLEQAAGLLHKEPASLRLLLLASIPRLAAHFRTAAEAESVVEKLRVLGLKAFACPDSFLRQPSSAFSANRLLSVDKEIVFGARRGSDLALRAEEVVLIIQGVKQTRLEQQTTQTMRKLNLPATILSGGIPFFKKVVQKTNTSTTSAEYFIRLYRAGDPQPRVEIRQRDFDYAFLGSRVAPSSQANLFLTAREMRRLFPAGKFDDRLTRPLVAETATMAGWDMSEVNCRLVYLWRQIG